MGDKKRVGTDINVEGKSVQVHGNDLKSGSLLDQSLSRLSDEQTNNLLEKAAEEAIKLEVKAREQNLDYVIGRKATEDHIDTFNQLDRNGKLTRHNMASDIKTGAGNMRIESKSGASCFVATVAYGDQDHPDVAFLRKFRDEVLVNSYSGRCFIDWYWKVGPKIANFIKNSRLMIFCSRYLISRLVAIIRKFY